MSSYNIYSSSSSSPGNGSVSVSSRSSLTGDRESYSSRIRTRDIDNGTFEESTSSHISGSKTNPRLRRSEDNSESKKMQNLHIGQVSEEAGGAEGASASPKQRLKDRKGASSSPRSGKFANRRMREKRRGTGKVVVEDDGFMDEIAKENAVKNSMISSTADDNDAQTSPVISRELQPKDDDDENGDSTQSRVERRRAARQRRQMQEEGSGNGGSSSSLISNDRPSRERHSGHDSGGLQQKLDLANLTISHLNDEVDRLKKELSTIKEDLTRERDEKGSLLKAMTSLTR